MATRTTAPASNYACDTLLSKSNDSTTGIPSVTNSTGLNHSSAYIVNAGSDVAPVVQGIVTFDGAPKVPAGLIQSVPLDVSGLANGTSANLLSLFPGGATPANGTYLLAFQNTTSPGQSVSAVGRIVSNSTTILELDGFNASMVSGALVGGQPSVIQITSNGSSSIGLYNSSGAPVSGNVSLFKIGSSN